MSILYRAVRAEDLQQSDALVVASINNLTQKYGFGSIASSRPTLFQSFCLEDDPGGLWVAEEADEIIGFAWSWSCGTLWFLAQLFVSPAHQGRGIGNELLNRTFAHATKSGARTRALITFAFNTVSQGLYIQNGLFPQTPIYSVSLARQKLIGRLKPTNQITCAPIERSDDAIHRLAEIDTYALGASREKHHCFLLQEGATRGFTLHEKNECVGYFYVSREGHIGPLAVMPSYSAAAAFLAALNVAGDGSSANVSAFIPGASAETLASAIGCGMRITLPMLLMSSEPFGDWTRYLPRNPGFM